LEFTIECGSIDHIWSRSEIDKMITRTDPIICNAAPNLHIYLIEDEEK